MFALVSLIFMFECLSGSRPCSRLCVGCNIFLIRSMHRSFLRSFSDFSLLSFRASLYLCSGWIILSARFWILSILLHCFWVRFPCHIWAPYSRVDLMTAQSKDFRSFLHAPWFLRIFNKCSRSDVFLQQCIRYSWITSYHHRAKLLTVYMT